MACNFIYVLSAVIRAIAVSSKDALIDIYSDKNIVLHSIIKKLSHDMYIFKLLQEKNEKALKVKKQDSVTEVYNRVHDALIKEKEPLSFTIFASNLSILSSKMSNFFIFQDKLLKVYKWHNPFLTLAVLLFLTFVCYYPILFLLIPVFQVIVLMFLPVPTLPDNSLQENKEIDKGDQLSINVVNSMEFIINLTDLQNLLSYFVNHLERLDSYLISRKNKLKIKFNFFCLVIATISMLFTVFFIKHSLAHSSLYFAVILWTVFLKQHPFVIFFLNFEYQMPENLLRTDVESKNIYKTFLSYLKQINTITENYDKVFEIQQKDKKTCLWTTLIFTRDPSAILCEQQTLIKNLSLMNCSLKLKGYKKLENIKPKSGWEFKLNSAWKVDKKSKSSKWLLAQKTFPLEFFKLNKNCIEFNNQETEFAYLVKYAFRIRRLKRSIIRTLFAELQKI